MKKISFFLLIFLLFVGELNAQRQNKWRNYLDVTALQNTDLVKSGDNFWMGTGGGLVRYNTFTGNHTVFQPDSCAIKGSKITSVCSDSTGGVWFSTNVSGLQHFDGTTFRWWATKNSGEALSRLRKIQLDRQNRLWMMHLTDAGASLQAEILVFQNGQTLQVAKNSSSRTTSSSSGTPIIKDIPYIGPGFGNSQSSSESESYAVFVTVELD